MSRPPTEFRRWGTRGWGPPPERVLRTLTRLDVRIDHAEFCDEYEEAERLRPRRERILRLLDRLE